MLTLRELLNMVDVAEVVAGEQVPGPRAMRLSSEVVVKELMKDGSEITVFKNGFVHYKSINGETVFPLHSCKSYTYEFVNEGAKSKMDIDFFADEAWYLRLVLEGEDRIEANNDRAQGKACVSYSAESEDWKVLADQAGDALDIFLRDEFWRIMKDEVDEKHWECFYDVYYHGAKYAEIARELGISRQAATRMVERTKKHIIEVLLREGYKEN